MNTDRHRSSSEHSHASRVMLTILAAIVIILFVWAISAISGSLARVKSIKIIDEYINCPYSEQQVVDAAGIFVGMYKKDLDIAGSEDDILRRLPFVSRVQIRKRLGGEVCITLYCQTPRYAANIAGEQYLLSEDFRVLGIGDVTQDVMPLTLPHVKCAITGQKVIYFEDGKFVSDTLKTLLASELSDKLDSVDLSDRYSVCLLYDDRFTVRLGDTFDLDAKLSMVARMLADESVSGAGQATLDVSDIDHPTVRRTSDQMP